MNPKRIKLRILAKGPYHGRVGKFLARDIASHSIVIRLRNGRNIIWPQRDVDKLQVIE